MSETVLGVSCTETVPPTVVPHVRYIIVVHGMGEQRKNETVLSVITRFAEARSDRLWPPPPAVLTLGAACAQTGKEVRGGFCRHPLARSQSIPWMEFQGVPFDSQNPFVGPFFGEPGTAGLRFVDVHWADLLTEDFPDVGQDPETWTDGLLGRLRRKDAHAQQQKRPELGPPKWAMEVLEALRESFLLFHSYARLRAQELDELVFTKYLGDVQLYGEYAHTRGRAVRRFHDLMEQIERQHKEIEDRKKPEDRLEARYTVIAHSLGSVMSMDALLSAHASPSVRAGKQPGGPNFPFGGYLDNDDKEKLCAVTASDDIIKKLPSLDTSWVERVDSFVTLGAPIDKFLLMWWLNYRYLLDSVPWTGKRIVRKKKIEHFNYCEEQDPVGHHLDLAKSAPAFQDVFDTLEDRVYTRYALPGVAHTSYWNDRDLFRWILHRAVDRPGGAVDYSLEPHWFDCKIYWQVLFFSYWVIPGAFALAGVFTFTWALYTESWHFQAVLALAFFGIWLLGRYLTDLFVWWRMISAAKYDAAAQNAAKARRAASEGAPAPSPVMSRMQSLREVRMWCELTAKDLRVNPAASPASAAGGSPRDTSKQQDNGEASEAPIQGEVDPRRQERDRRMRDERAYRQQEEMRFRGKLTFCCYFHSFVAVIGFSLLFGVGVGGDLFRWQRLAFIAAIFATALILWIKLFYSRNAAWQEQEAFAHLEKPPGSPFPQLSANLRQRIHYDEGRKRLVFAGIMHPSQRQELVACFPNDTPFKEAVGALFQQSWHAGQGKGEGSLFRIKRLMKKVWEFLEHDRKVMLWITLPVPILAFALSSTLAYFDLDTMVYCRLHGTKLPYVLLILASVSYAFAGTFGYLRHRFYDLKSRLLPDLERTIDFFQYAEAEETKAAGTESGV